MNAVLNVATGVRYPPGQKRLIKSLDAFHEPAVRFMRSGFPRRSHNQVPYAFKPDLFMEVKETHVERAIWIDASCWLVKPLDTAWAQLERDGYLLGQEGWTVGQWCSPEVRDFLGRTQEELDTMTLVEGKFIGIDFTSDVGNEFLKRWSHYSDIGVFNGSWNNHRHDITAAGIIAHDMGLTLTPHLIEFDSKEPSHPDVYVRASGL